MQSNMKSGNTHLFWGILLYVNFKIHAYKNKKDLQYVLSIENWLQFRIPANKILLYSKSSDKN